MVWTGSCVACCLGTKICRSGSTAAKWILAANGTISNRAILGTLTLGLGGPTLNAFLFSKEAVEPVHPRGDFFVFITCLVVGMITMVDLLRQAQNITNVTHELSLADDVVATKRSIGRKERFPVRADPAIP